MSTYGVAVGQLRAFLLDGACRSPLARSPASTSRRSSRTSWSGGSLRPPITATAAARRSSAGSWKRARSRVPHRAHEAAAASPRNPLRCFARPSCAPSWPHASGTRRSTGRRDEALIRCFIDTGARRAEILGLTPEALDLDGGSLRVTGKGSRTRLVAIGAQTARALDRYLRARARHPLAALPQLWLGGDAFRRPASRT